jgi:hypothetical protein
MSCDRLHAPPTWLICLVRVCVQVECFAPVEPSLLGRDLVLNCEYPDWDGQLHNAAMAAAPRHPFWLAVLREAMKRAPAHISSSSSSGSSSSSSSSGSSSSSSSDSYRSVTSTTARPWHVVAGALHSAAAALWRASPWYDAMLEVLWSTGPILLTDVYKVQWCIYQMIML